MFSSKANSERLYLVSSIKAQIRFASLSTHGAEQRAKLMCNVTHLVEKLYFCYRRISDANGS